jgi:hypothetical protein
MLASELTHQPAELLPAATGQATEGQELVYSARFGCRNGAVDVAVIFACNESNDLRVNSDAAAGAGDAGYCGRRPTESCRPRVTTPGTVAKARIDGGYPTLE